MARIKKAQVVAMLTSPEDVEAQFYEALREGNLGKLMAVWAEDEEVVCIHPGGPRLVGPAAVRAAFEAVFSNGAVAVQPDNVRRVHAMGLAVHSVVEKVQIHTDQGPRLGYVMATNVYLKTSQGWRMVAHHASPGTPNEPPELVETPSVLH
ncbi:MAG: nuclear transport factor 2 family protein [Vitreoscilla sp.]|nr:nuclear transport factor 2 family protein [Burkholderiales bacterium]MBP6338754.1 nuclear transport factor 2 family protein [Vitreoscilla sp.]MBP6674919.1 nuclear transport factor 2 family protein [Vitreoscilla sp.]